MKLYEYGKMHPNSIVQDEITPICGMTRVKTQVLADRYKTDLGDWIYIVEYIGGCDTEVPECYLEKYKE